MISIIQTNFNGIDGLKITETDKPTITDNDVLVKMNILPVVPTDWKRESNPNATSEQFSQLPRVIGIGGVGKVVAVGKNRNSTLLNQRVLILNPTGSYSEYVSVSNPDFIFLLPASVSDEAAAALTAGPGTALTLKHEIEQSTAENIVITGANSVIGIYLLQLIKADQAIWPIVSPASTKYFESKFPSIQSYAADHLPHITGSTLLIDIAGNEALLGSLLSHLMSVNIISIALMKLDTTVPSKFVHEEFNPENYRNFIKQVQNGELEPPIDRIFPVCSIKEAQHYAKESHSRGRVLVSFE